MGGEQLPMGGEQLPMGGEQLPMGGEQLPMGGEQLPGASKYQKSLTLFIASESKSLFSCPGTCSSGSVITAFITVLSRVLLN
jgi:hypothetical protein